MDTEEKEHFYWVWFFSS